VFLSTDKITKHYNIGRRMEFTAFDSVGKWEIHSCTHVSTQQKRAVKIYDKVDLAAAERKQLFKEIVNLKSVDHPNIPKLIEMFDDIKRYYVVFEDIRDCKELFEVILDKQHFKESDALLLVKQLLSCLNVLHQKNIIIRDLRPEKILWEKVDANHQQIKLIDFSSASIHRKENRVDGAEFMNFSHYTAPEILDGRFTAKCDIWSTGVIAYILLGGQPPFRGNNNKKIAKSIKQRKLDFDGAEWKHISQEAKDFIDYLLTLDEDARPSAKEAMEHPWIMKAQEI